MSSANTSTLRRGRMSSHEASSDANEWARKKKEAAEKAKHIKEERMRAQLLREMQSKLDNDAQQQTQALAEGVALHLEEEEEEEEYAEYEEPVPAARSKQRQQAPSQQQHPKSYQPARLIEVDAKSGGRGNDYSYEDFREDIQNEEVNEMPSQRQSGSKERKEKRPEWNSDFVEEEAAHAPGRSHDSLAERPAFSKKQVAKVRHASEWTAMPLEEGGAFGEPPPLPKRQNKVGKQASARVSSHMPTVKRVTEHGASDKALNQHNVVSKPVKKAPVKASGYAQDPSHVRSVSKPAVKTDSEWGTPANATAARPASGSNIPAANRVAQGGVVQPPRISQLGTKAPAGPGAGAKRFSSKPQENEKYEYSENDKATRTMLDKRALRHKYKHFFQHYLRDWQGKRLMKPSFLNDVPSTPPSGAGLSNNVNVYVRKRPIFKHELARGEYDVITVPDDRRVILHNCMFEADLKRMYIKHQQFACTKAFNERADNDDVYRAVGEPMVNTVLKGGVATLFMYGQTGSGKTYTMQAVEERAIKALYKRFPEGTKVTLTFFEIAGKKCWDLLAPGREVQLMEKDGVTHPKFAEVLDVSKSAEDLLEVLDEAHAFRATSETDINSVSSRSHAVCQIAITSPGAADTGRFTLVDCAGSERKEDSMYHSAERRKEGAEINASLHALKECIRYRAAGGAKAGHHVPFRNSNLTRVLMESFVREDALLSVISTVSPNPTDTEHSVRTVATATAMVSGTEVGSMDERQDCGDVYQKMPGTVVKQMDPRKWNNVELVEWMVAARSGSFAPFVANLPPGMTGKALLKLTQKQIAKTVFGNDANPQGNELFNHLRIALEKADQETKKRLKELKSGPRGAMGAR